VAVVKAAAATRDGASVKPTPAGGRS
jgi:hypothetical protein